MQSINVMPNKKNDPLSEKEDKQPDENQKNAPGDIHKVVDGKVVPTRAPSQIEEDIPPGITTRK